MLEAILRTPNRRIIGISVLIVALDQLTKGIVRELLGSGERIVIPGFFKLVNWNNTGAAWSLFRGYNFVLAAIAVVALIVLVLNRHRFNGHTWLGQMAFGLIFGGIIGNLTDRVVMHHVTDFLYFYFQRPENGFPAFNVADSAICTGVGLIFLITWKVERRAAANREEGKPTTPFQPRMNPDEHG
ncbi:MAG: signal peptidase II [Verrucomicrobia bacterium]|nr:MAG: signal peptidase II [Verrucomicrobiota bacterium]